MKRGQKLIQGLVNGIGRSTLFGLLRQGEGTDGLACVRFGMVTADTDVAELISLVDSVGKQEEDSWKFIDTMAEVVKKGKSSLPMIMKLF